MAGGTLVVSRAKNLFPIIKKKVEDYGFTDVVMTTKDKDGLDMQIIELKPRFIIVSSNFYNCATPYMIGRLVKKFPKISVAVVSLTEYPVELAMWFVAHGVKSYVCLWDGLEEFNKGIISFRNGVQYISPSVLEFIDERGELPQPKKKLSLKEKEVLLLVCNGYDAKEIGEIMQISVRTVQKLKQFINKALQSRNDREMIRVALYLNLISFEDLNFYSHKDSLKNKKGVLKNQRPADFSDRSFYVVKTSAKAVKTAASMPPKARRVYVT